MKVRCKECNKRFDYDLYSGVCPKCGMYMRLTETTSENDDCRIEGSHAHYETNTATYTQTHMESASAPSKKEKKKYKPGVTVALLIAMATVGLMTYIVLGLFHKQVHEENTVPDDIKVSTLKQGDVITYSNEYNRYDIRIESLTLDNDPALEIPEGYDALVVSYSIERTFLDNGGHDFDSFYEIAMRPYLVTKGGVYVDPVSEFYIRDRKGIEETPEPEDVEISELFRHQQGMLYFFVKDGDAQALHIISSDYDRDKYEWGAVREIIRVEELEVTE